MNKKDIKKNLKKKLIVAICIMSVLVSMTACSTEKKEDENKVEAQVPSAQEQTYESLANGYGGEVKVTLSTSDGKITAITVVGALETEAIGGKAIEQYNNEDLKMLIGSSLEEVRVEDIDAITGATVTSTAVKNALTGAINDALGIIASEKAEVVDGVQEVTVPGHSLIAPMKVAVTFANKQISNIEVLENSETAPIFATVEENLIPRIIETQSLAVDSISGATVSSNAVKTAVAEAIKNAGGEALEWNTAVTKSEETVVLDGYDVIVVGLGGAGMSAYASAAASGATVFGFDTAAKVGGTSTNVSGPMAINPKTKMEIQNNGEPFLNEEELIADWLEYCKGDAKEDVVRLMVEESGDTMDWLMNDFGFDFGDITPFFHPKMWAVWATYTGDIDAQYNSAMQQAKAMNDKNDYMLELTATKLLTDDAGNVSGVEATYYDGTVYQIKGKAVVLATGGFAGNSELMTKYFNSPWNLDAMAQNDGSGILMAQEVGAALYNIDVAPMQHNVQTATIIRDDSLTADEKAVLASFILQPDSLIVNEAGKRFMNEAGNIAFDSWKGGAYYYSLYSQEQMQQFEKEGLTIVGTPFFLGQGGSVEPNTPIATMDKVIEVAIERGIIYKANSAAELEGLLGMEQLSSEIEAYNSYANGTNTDPLGKENTLIHAIDTTKPVYAVKGAAYIYGTCGGLDVDESLTVLDTNGNEIKGLYATGLDSMGTILTNQEAYVTYGGAAQGWALTSGKVAGENAAGYALEAK